MSGQDDYPDVSGNVDRDIAAMAMARQTLRALVPEVTPAPTEKLAAVLRDGVSAVGARRPRQPSLTSRLASLGVTAKILLTAGVAAAGIGSAAGAVAVTRHHAPTHIVIPRDHPSPAAPATAPTNSATDPRGASTAPAPASTATASRTTTEEERGSNSGDRSSRPAGESESTPTSAPAGASGDGQTQTSRSGEDTPSDTTTASPQSSSASAAGDTPDPGNSDSGNSGDSGDGGDSSPTPTTGGDR